MWPELNTVIISGAVICYVIFTLVSTSPVVFSKCNQSPFIIFRFLSAVTLGIGVTVWNFTAQADTWAGVTFPFLSLDRMWQTGLTGWAQPFVLQEQHPSSVACIPFASLLFFCTLYDMRFYWILMLIQSTEVWPHYSHFSFHEKQSKRSRK